MDSLTQDITFDYRDEYQRRPVAENVIRLLTSDARVSPMVIDGGWGTGKTEFCFKLINLIKEKDLKYKAIYVDAFSADHADEPLVTILAAILKLLPENKKKALINKALPVIRYGVKTTLKAGVSWLLKQDVSDLVDGFDKDIKKAGDEAINQSIKTLLKDHVEAEKSIETLREALGALSKEKPIVIFVDELDRCRPDFSIVMLENIKHIFNVEGVKIVLVENMNQLCASINHRYGSSIDAQRYLDKFVGFSFSLSAIYKPSQYELVYVSIQHIEKYIKTSNHLKDSCLLRRDIPAFIELLIRENNLSLREAETFSRYLEIYQVITNGEGLSPTLSPMDSVLRIFGVFLSCFKPIIANELQVGTINLPKLAKALGKIRIHNFIIEDRYDYGDIVVAILSQDTSYAYPEFSPDNIEEKRELEHELGKIFSDREFPIKTKNSFGIIAEPIHAFKLGFIIS